MALNYLEAVLDWCKIKIPLSEKKFSILFNGGEIWWCHIGMNVGEEEFGHGPEFIRPVLIFKKFSQNSFLGLPLSGHEKEGNWYFSLFVVDRKASVMFNQARVFDKRRLANRMVTMMDDDFLKVQAKFKEIYCPEKVLPSSFRKDEGQWEIPNVLSV